VTDGGVSPEAVALSVAGAVVTPGSPGVLSSAHSVFRGRAPPAL
jgi:hypothetical protein